jgi:hypothetical protein
MAKLMENGCNGGGKVFLHVRENTLINRGYDESYTSWGKGR